MKIAGSLSLTRANTTTSRYHVSADFIPTWLGLGFLPVTLFAMLVSRPTAFICPMYSLRIVNTIRLSLSFPRVTTHNVLEHTQSQVSTHIWIQNRIKLLTIIPLPYPQVLDTVPPPTATDAAKRSERNPEHLSAAWKFAVDHPLGSVMMTLTYVMHPRRCTAVSLSV